MTKNQLISVLAKKCDITKKEAENVLGTFIDIVEEQLIAGDKVQITGFGTFEVRSHDERNGRNPYTGESIVIPPSRRPAFVPGKNLKEKIK